MVVAGGFGVSGDDVGQLFEFTTVNRKLLEEPLWTADRMWVLETGEWYIPKMRLVESDGDDVARW